MLASLMPRKPPTLRQKSNGAFFVRIGRRDYSLGSDSDEAEARYARLIATVWAPRYKRASPVTVARRLDVVELVELLLDSYADEGRDATVAYYRKHLARFVNVHGTADVVTLASAEPKLGRYQAPIVPLLNAFVADLRRLDYEPKTIRHDVGAVVRLFNFAHERGVCPSVDFKPVKKPRAMRGEPRVLTQRELLAAFLWARRRHPSLEPWMRVQYHALLRPSEIVRLVAAVSSGEGGAFEPVRNEREKVVSKRGLFRLDVHKGSWRDGTIQTTRAIVLTGEALRWLDRCEPTWSRLDSYSGAVRRLLPGRSPDMLRDSAASRLLALGERREDVDALLGHGRPSELPSYGREAWHVLLRSAGRLRLEPERRRDRRVGR